MIIPQNFTISNGVKIPVVGFGTWQIRAGNAVRHSGIPRNEIFVTSKLPAEIKSYDGALKYFDRTIENLSLDYVDLYLIHAPWPWGKKGEDFTKENINVWRAMEEIYTTGHCRAIGVSNFSVYDLTAVMDNCTIIPMANQIKYHIGYTQEEVTQFCLKNNILVEGYSPLASGAITDNREITAIAQKYNITVPQICIRYVLQKGVIPLPKSTHSERILQNLDIGFTIEEDDMIFLDELRDTV